MTEVTPPLSDEHRTPRSPAISSEFFPPKTEEMERNLWETIKRLAPLVPTFVSVTYGAGGSTRERTHSTIARILAEPRLTPAAHLTRGGAAGGRRCRRPLSGGRRPPYRRTSRRSARRHRHRLRHASGWLSPFGGSRGRHQAAAWRYRGFRLRISRKTP